jgi:hypothetical protein
MATRSRIGIELADGSILSAYHHWDGYPEWLGRILRTHYHNRDKVAALIDGGDMSSCWTEDRWDSKAQEYGAQYYSQRGEDTPPRYDSSLKEYLSAGEEFAYLYRKGEWVCYDMHQFEKKKPSLVEIPAGNLAV